MIDPADLIRLAHAVPLPYRAFVLVGGVLGLRWGEAIALRTCDIDFMRRTVTVAQVVEEVAGHLRVLPGEAKTAGSLRTLAAPPFLIDELARHMEAHRPGAVGDRQALASSALVEASSAAASRSGPSVRPWNGPGWIRPSPFTASGTSP